MYSLNILALFLLRLCRYIVRQSQTSISLSLKSKATSLLRQGYASTCQEIRNSWLAYCIQLNQMYKFAWKDNFDNPDLINISRVMDLDF